MKISKYIVYGLVDPRNEELFYIGKSCKGCESMRRHTQPWSLNSKTNKEKSEKILDILSDELDVMYVILEECRNRKHVEMRERVLIAKYRGEALLNITCNRRLM